MIELINKAKKLGWQLEIKEIKENFIMLRTLNNEVKQYEASNIASYQIKAILEGKTLIINCDDISDTDMIIKTLQDNYKLLDNTDEDFLARESIVYECSDRTVLDINELRSDLLNLYEYNNNYPNIVNIDSILDSNIKVTNIVNSNDIELKQNTNFNSIYISVSVNDNKNVSEASDYYLFNEYNKDELISLFENVLNDAIKRLEEITIKSNKYNVIINNNSMYSILKSFKEMFFAKNINKGLSILSESLQSTH